MQPKPRKSKTWLLALGFLAVVSLLAAIKPPTAHTPTITIQHSDGFDLQVVLSKKNTLEQCRTARQAVQTAYLKACPDCQLVDWGCIASVGPAISTIQSETPLKSYSLRFSGGDIVFNGTRPTEAMKLACETAAAQGAGRCYSPYQVRAAPAHQTGVGSSLLMESIPIDRLFGALAATAVLTLVLCLALVATKPLHGRFTLDDRAGVQRFHEESAPRIGGLAILIALFLSVWFFLPLASDQKTELIWPAMVAGLAAFVFGFAEDITKSIGVAPRLIATMGCAVLAWWITGVSLDSVDLAPVDWLLSFKVVSVLFTAFAVGGVANAINIIDGFHGLASGVAIIILIALGFVAFEVGDFSLAVFAALVAASIIGFFLVNYPLGKLFLGDGGAYYLGFLIAWIAVLLPARNPNVSPWVSLLICGYPIAETLFTIYRRIRSRSMIGLPDREHLHSLIKQHWISPRFQHWSLDARNALVAPWGCLLAVIPVLVAVFNFENTSALIIFFILYCLLYQAVYIYMIRRPVYSITSN